MMMIRKLAAIFGQATIVGLLVAALAAIPAVRSQFAQNNYAGTSTGTANAQVITVPNIAALTDILNQPITYNVGAGLTNTAGMTLNVSGLGAQPVLRAIPSGLVALGGAEVVAAQRVIVMWDGTQFQLLTNANPALPGTIIDYGGTSCPTGHFAANSQTPSQVAYPALFAVLGTTWGSPGGGNFSTPDLRARSTYGQDQNQAGFSNRITVAGGNFNGQTVGAAGGVQNVTLNVNQIPIITPAGVLANVIPVGIADSRQWALEGGQIGTNLASAGATYSLAGGSGTGPIGATGVVTVFAGSISGSFNANLIQFNGAVFNSGGGQAHSTLSNGAIVSKCVRA